MVTLCNGWEADTPTSDTLLRRWNENLIASWAIPVIAMGGEVLRLPNLTLLDVGRPADFLNAAIFTTPPAYSDERAMVEAVSRRFPPGIVPELWSAWPLADHLERGWAACDFYPFMYRPAGSATPPFARELEIREVREKKEADTFFRIVAEGFEMHDLLADPPRLNETILDRRTIRLFLGYLRGEPVATSATVSEAGLNGVSYVTTRPSYRGRGIGSVMTARASEAWPDLPAALVASPPGRPVYERLGYIPISRYTILKPAAAVA